MSQAILLLTLLLATDVWASSVNKLMTTVQLGSTDRVAQLIKQIPINSRDADFRTAAHHALIHKQTAVFKLLVTNGADLSLKDKNGDSTYDLYYNLKKYGGDAHYREEIHRIINNMPYPTAGMKIEEQDAYYEARTAEHIFLYAEDGNQAALETMIRAKKNFHIRNTAGEFPHQVAMKHGHSELATILREAAGIDAGDPATTAKAKGQFQALFKAAEEGNRPKVELLLQAGADPNVQNTAGELPYHVALRNKHPAIAAILLTAISDVNQDDDKSWTALHLAVLAKDWEMVRELLREGAKFRTRWHYRHRSGGPNEDAYDIAELTNQTDLFVETIFAEGRNDIVYALMKKVSQQSNLDLYQKLLDNGLDLQDEEVAKLAAMIDLPHRL